MNQFDYFNMFRSLSLVKNKSILVVLLFLILSPALNLGQTQKDYIKLAKENSFNHRPLKNIMFNRLTGEDGLSQLTVRTIIQDQSGFMWFGTDNGLNRWDGNSVKIYRHEINNPNSLSESGIFRCFLSKQGDLWVVTHDMVFNQYVPHQDHFIRINFEFKSQVTGILEDSKDKIWVTTNSDGLFCYNQKTGDIKKFFDQLNPPKTKNKKIRNIFSSLLVSRDDSVWVGSAYGLIRYDQANQTFFRHPFNPVGSIKPGVSKQSNNRLVYTIHEGQDGKIWLGMIFGGLQSLNRETGEFTSYPFSLDRSDTFYGNTAFKIFEDSDGGIWVNSRQFRSDFTFKVPRLVRYNPKTGSIIQYPANPKNPLSLSQGNALVMMEDSRKLIWIHTFGGGVDIYHPDTNSFTHFYHNPQKRTSLGDNSVSCMFEDNAGTIWLGSENNGVSYYNLINNMFSHYSIDVRAPNRLSNQLISRIQGSTSEINKKGRADIVWVSTQAGLNRWDKKNNVFSFYKIDPKIPNTFPTAICEDHRGNLWIGCGMGLYRGKLKHFINKKSEVVFDLVLSRIGNDVGIIFDIIVDQDYLWLASFRMGLGHYHIPTGEVFYYQPDPDNPENDLDKQIIRLQQRRDGTFWVVTRLDVKLFNPTSKIFTKVYPGNDKTAPEEICGFHESSNGTIWMGINNLGLVEFDPKSKNTKVYNKTSGLPDNSVWAILPELNRSDNKKILWISTNNGLCRFDPVKESFQTFYLNDSLHSNNFKVFADYLAPDGEMYFGGINGITTFFPQNITLNKYIPPLQITSFKVLNKELNNSLLQNDSELNLSYRDKMFSFEFVALDFTNPKKNMFAYKLEGFNDDWIYTDYSNRIATFTNIPPGTYKFRVKGSNNHGIWNNQGLSVNVFIKPPFWQTWWFKLLFLIFISLSILTIHKKRMNNLRIRIKTDNEIDQIFKKCKITNREKEVIDLLRAGKNNKEIEDKLYISYHTVKNHIHNIFTKLNVNNRVELIYYFKSIKDQISKE